MGFNSAFKGLRYWTTQPEDKVTEQKILNRPIPVGIQMKEFYIHITLNTIAALRNGNSLGQRITHSMLEITLNLHLMLS